MFWIVFMLIAYPLSSCGQAGNMHEEKKRGENKQKRTGEYSSSSAIGYDLSAPDRIYVLPPVLLEISGITALDATTIACVEDEHETIYIYDISKSQITRQIFTGHSGDYEGIARVGKTLFLLRSDGRLTEISDYDSDDFRRSTFATRIPWIDNEGLCYDRENNRLLVAPKEIPKKDSRYRDFRLIYSFDLADKKLLPEPVFRFSMEEIRKFALANKVGVPLKNKKKAGDSLPDIKFRTSAIGIHPVTGNLFVISGPESILFVFDKKGNIVFMEQLDSDLFRQPEGITFMNNGDMFISNEGKGKAATLVKFSFSGINLNNY